MKNRWKRRTVLILCVLTLLFSALSVSVYADQAMGTESTGQSSAANGYDKTFYENNMDVLETHNFTSDTLRTVSWFVTKSLAKLGKVSQDLYDTAFGFIDWTTNEKINKYIDKFKPVFIALMALSLVFLGIVLIVQHEKKPNIAINIMIAILCVTCSTAFFSQMNKMTVQLKGGIENGLGGTRFAAAYNVINDNLVDLVAVDQSMNGLQNMNFSTHPEKVKGLAAINGPKTLARVKYDEVLNYKSGTYAWNGDTSEILKYRLVDNPNGKGGHGTKVVKIYNGIGLNSGDDTDMFNEFYYRYHFDSWAAWLEMIALAIIYLMMSYKCIRIIFELIVSRVLAYLYSAEISGGEKIKKILCFIRDSYILLLVTTLCIRIYLFMSALIAGQTDIQGLAKGLFCLFIAFCVIDGPNLVEKLLGMDAGLKSSTARFMAGVGMIRGAAGAGMATAAALTPKNIAGKLGAAKHNIQSGDVARGGVAAAAYKALSGDGNEKDVHSPGADTANNEHGGAAGSAEGATANNKTDVNNQNTGQSNFNQQMDNANSSKNESTQSGAADVVNTGTVGETLDTDTSSAPTGHSFMNEPMNEKSAAQNIGTENRFDNKPTDTGSQFMDKGTKQARTTQTNSSGSTSLPRRTQQTNSKALNNIMDKPSKGGGKK